MRLRRDARYTVTFALIVAGGTLVFMAVYGLVRWVVMIPALGGYSPLLPGWVVTRRAGLDTGFRFRGPGHFPFRGAFWKISKGQPTGRSV